MSTHKKYSQQAGVIGVATRSSQLVSKASLSVVPQSFTRGKHLLDCFSIQSWQWSRHLLGKMWVLECKASVLNSRGEHLSHAIHPQCTANVFSLVVIVLWVVQVQDTFSVGIFRVQDKALNQLQSQPNPFLSSAHLCSGGWPELFCGFASWPLG